MTSSSDAPDPETDASANDRSPPGGPLRLDGAFPRRDVDDWRAAADASLRGGTTLDDLARTTADGLRIDVLYHDSPVDGRVTPTAAERAAASDAPAWDNRLHALGDTPAAVAAHALAGLAGGVTSLELDVGGAAPAPTDTGPRVPLAALPDALEGVHLDMITLSLRAGDETDAAADALLALCRARELDPRALRVELDADPLGELARRGRVEGGVAAARTRLAALATRAAEELPEARVVSVDTVVHHAAGASPVQELVAAVATATDYVDAMLDAGVSAERAVRTLAFRVALDADLVGGIVKLRALERLWRHALAIGGLPVARPHVVAETSRRHLSRLAPWVNHLRNTSACVAAAIGGADVVVVHPHDQVDGQRLDADGGGDAAVADRVARNLPILLAEEGGLLAVDDAAGGAHAIESLTQATVEAVWTALGELDAEGGLAAALESGAWRDALARTHAERVARLAAGDAVRVGVNRYRHDGKPPPPLDANDAGARPDAAHGDGATAPGESTGDDPRSAVPLRPVREAHAFEAQHGEAGPIDTGAPA